MSTTIAHVRPGAGDIKVAVAALPHVKGYLSRHQDRDDVRLVVHDELGDETLTVPRGAVELLARILAHMAAGQGVSVVPTHAELTTQQAADLLNVSRPFLIGLLDAGEIDYRKVGKHRRVKAASLLDYLRADDQHRRDAADELSALTQEMGLT
jgi:excisionase family DNA binding protein